MVVTFGIWLTEYEGLLGGLGTGSEGYWSWLIVLLTLLQEASVQAWMKSVYTAGDALVSCSILPPG